MVSNIWFDVCAILLMLVILYTHSLKKNLRLKQNIIFMSLLASVMITAISGMTGTVIENAAVNGGFAGIYWGNFSCLLSYIYFTCHIMTPALYIMYIYSTLNMSRTRLYEFFALYLPIVLALISLLFNPVTKGIFYYDSMNIYHRGNMIGLFYAVAVYYVIYGVLLLYYFRRNIRHERSMALISFALFSIVGTWIQLVWPNMRVENFFNSLVIMMLYISIERPEDLMDSQTGYPNATAFYFYTDISFRRNREMNFVLISIDNILMMEKQLGRERVEILLLQAAKFFGRFSGQADIYRMGQGLFAIVMKSGREPAAENIISIIHERFTGPFITDTYNIILSECCCYISCPKDADNLENVRRLIDLAADSSIHRNRHSIKVYELDVNGDNRRRKIGRILKTAIEDNILDIRYQPVYEVAAARFSGVETQVTVNAGQDGIITSKEFMPVSESNGYTGEISIYVFERVCAFIECSRPDEYGYRVFEITLPVSELMKRDAVDTIVSVADRHRVPHHMIAFEITEDTIVSFQGIIEYNIETLHDRGFNFVLDNYGNGYTNAGMLLKMPLSLVTLDRRLTQAAITSHRADTLLKCTVEMLKRLGKKLKAERIETTRQEEYAREIGCDYLQGYHLSMSLSEEEFVRFMKGGGTDAV